MTSEKFPDFLQVRMAESGFAGRIFGLRRWLKDARINQSPTESLTVIALLQSGRRLPVFNVLAREGIAFNSVFLQIGGEKFDSNADIHLVFHNDTPLSTARNIGASIGPEGILVFLEATAVPCEGFLRAYLDTFERFPQTIACRGRIRTPGLEAAAAITGNFVLPDAIELWPVDLEENMAMTSAAFKELGGFDEAMESGYAALDLSIRLFGRKPGFVCQRHVPGACLQWNDEADTAIPFGEYLFRRQRSWLELNESMKRYLELYAKFWQENAPHGLPSKEAAYV